MPPIPYRIPRTLLEYLMVKYSIPLLDLVSEWMDSILDPFYRSTDIESLNCIHSQRFDIRTWLRIVLYLRFLPYPQVSLWCY
jgi:hypothetical protein